MNDTAFLFAGQGAQKVGMTTELPLNERLHALFDAAERVCPDALRVMRQGTQEELNRTLYTQPAMFIADLAYAYQAESEIGEPLAVCGFSVGEVAALTYAEAISVEDGLKIIVRRAESMDLAATANPGGMLAIVGLPAKAVEDVAASVGDAWAVNYNAPLQTVVACTADKIAAVEAAAKAAGGRAIRLKVSGAFHSPLMQTAADELAKLLANVAFKLPKMPVISNVTANAYPSGSDEMRALLAKQVVSPVRFVDCVENLAILGAENFREVGPGNVLTGLVAKIRA